MKSDADTIDAYLASLPEPRRAALAIVRRTILANLDSDYEEGMQYGMIGYYVPHRVFPAGYHCDPSQGVPFAGLASQKAHMSLYLMGLYCGCGTDLGAETADARWFRQAWLATGKKLDMGRACVRFKRLDDVPLQVVGEAIARMPTARFLAHYQATLAAPRPARRKAARSNSPATRTP